MNNNKNNKIEVKAFKKADNNSLALIEKVTDQLNKPCALIIVRNIDAGGFIFEHGSSVKYYIKVGNEETDSKGKYIKVWVSSSARRITIRNSDKGIGALTGWEFPERLEPGQVYKMELEPVFRTDNDGRQYVKFSIIPDNADVTLEVKDEETGIYVPLDLREGKAAAPYRFGTYNFKVTGDDFHEEIGKFTVQDPDRPLELTINLRHNYGFLTVKGDDLADASIYIESKRYSLNQLSRLKLTSGQHTIKITKDLFQPYEQTFEIKDDQETVLTPKLDDDYSTVHINAPEGATIYINGQEIGVGNVTKMLGKGKYKVEVSKQGYRSKRWQLDVDKIKETYTQNIEALEPIYGKIDVESEPEGATISIDGVTIERPTPYTLRNILIGKHTIRLTHKGYQPYETTVNVTEGQTQKVSATLSNMVGLKLTYLPVDAQLQINGQNITATTPGTVTKLVEPGKTVSVNISKDGYHSQFKTYTMDGNKSDFINLKKIVYHSYNGWGREGGYRFESPRFFYISANYTLGGISSVGGCLGFQWRSLNMQFDGGYCIGSGTEVYEYRPASTAGYYTYYSNHYITPTYYYGGKIGLGLQLAFFNITPQIGYRHMDLKDTWVEQGTAGLRLQIRTSAKFAIIVNPEYYIPLMKGDLLKKANEMLPETKKYASGFQVGLGFDIYF